VGSATVLDALRGTVGSLLPIESASQHAGDVPPPCRKPCRGGLLLQSSGTTGRPKIAFRTAASLDAVAGATAEAIGFGPSDRVLLPLPLCHSYGVEHGLLAPVWAGSCVHLCRGFDLSVALRELTEGGITIFPGVPFMFESLAQRGGDGGGATALTSLRRAYSAGGPLPASVFEGFRARYGVAVTQLYGATEIGSVTFNDAGGPGQFDPASVGRPMRGVDVRVLEVDEPRADRPVAAGVEGQVAVRAASMMSGYLRDDDPGSHLADGFFLTGDLGRLDAGGRLTITGRIKLLIDVGGLKVNPIEVEEVLAGHPEVAACVVLPVRVSETLSRLKAVVQPKDPEGQGLSAESLRRFARGRLAPHKVPRLFEVRKSLPRSPAGKVLRHMVAA
jgi:acyl-CoA synthetase (AMP-forming)/AMP-acid ligase II